MKIRGLQTEDLFKAWRLISKIGVREEIREVAARAEENKGKKVQFDMGFDLMFGILDKATQTKAENEIYIFIADLFGCAPDEVRTMPPLELFNNLGQVADFEEWKNFFVSLKRMIMKK